MDYEQLLINNLVRKFKTSNSDEMKSLNPSRAESGTDLRNRYEFD